MQNNPYNEKKKKLHRTDISDSVLVSAVRWENSHSDNLLCLVTFLFLLLTVLYYVNNFDYTSLLGFDEKNLEF